MGGAFLLKFEQDPHAYRSLFYMLILGVIGTAIALILFNHLVRIKNPVFASSVTYLIPVVAILWGVLDNEELLPGHYLGILIIIAGIYIANRKEKPKPVVSLK